MMGFASHDQRAIYFKYREAREKGATRQQIVESVCIQNNLPINDIIARRRILQEMDKIVLLHLHLWVADLSEDHNYQQMFNTIFGQVETLDLERFLFLTVVKTALSLNYYTKTGVSFYE